MGMVPSNAAYESKGITGQFGTGLAVSELSSYRAVLNSPDPSPKRSISSVTSVKRRAAFHTVGGLDYRRRTVSEDRRRVLGSEVQIFTVSLNGANFLSTPIQSPT